MERQDVKKEKQMPKKPYTVDITSSEQLRPELQNLREQLAATIQEYQQTFSKVSQSWARMRDIIPRDVYPNVKRSLQPIADKISANFPPLTHTYKQVLESTEFNFNFSSDELLPEDIIEKLTTLSIRDNNSNNGDAITNASDDVYATLSYVQPDKHSKRSLGASNPQNITVAAQEKQRLQLLLNQTCSQTAQIQQQNCKKLLQNAEGMMNKRKLKLVDFFQKTPL